MPEEENNLRNIISQLPYVDMLRLINNNNKNNNTLGD
jgi:hypothetical protein